MEINNTAKVAITNYAIDRAKESTEKAVREALGTDAEVKVEYPPENIPADLAIPCFIYSKKLKKAPALIAGEIAEKINASSGDFIEKAEAVGGYLNVTLNKNKLFTEIFQDFRSYGELYGNSDIGMGKTVIIDYSSPNIAKPFSVGNIRSTIIGQAIYNILKAVGYKTIGDNHLGDWGTQFGKLIYAYKIWGNEEKVRNNPISELLDLYVKFHAEAKTNPSIEDEARRCFRELENGDPDAVRLWKWFVDISLNEFEKIYKRLGVKFEYVLGESFYNDKTNETVRMIEDAGIAERDADGALLVRLDSVGIDTPLLIRKSDGATLYATRDLAALIYRIKEFDPEMILYVVGSEQKLHFRQCFKVIEMLRFRTRCEHIDFGMVSLKEGKMSTREGRVIFFEDVLEEAYGRAREILLEKRPELDPEERDKIAEVVGIGAVKFNDLSQSRIKNVVFDWDRMLSFDGDTAPYLQYSYARVCSILRKAKNLSLQADFLPELLNDEPEIKLVKNLAKFPEVVRSAAHEFAPHLIAQYLLDLSGKFTTFYQSCPVLKTGNALITSARLGLIKAYALIVRRGLNLLGIDVLERM